MFLFYPPFHELYSLIYNVTFVLSYLFLFNFCIKTLYISIDNIYQSGYKFIFVWISYHFECIVLLYINAISEECVFMYRISTHSHIGNLMNNINRLRPGECLLVSMKIVMAYRSAMYAALGTCHTLGTR